MNMNDRTTVVGVFHDRARAEEAHKALRQAGFPENQISIVTRGEQGETGGAVAEPGNEAGTGAATGAAAGAGLAALASLGMTFGIIPVIGPVLAIGPLAAALLSAVGGAAAGGLVGALVGMGLPREEAEYYQEEVQGGRTLVTVRADGRHDEAWTILQRYGAFKRQNAALATARPAGMGQEATGGRTMKLREEELHARKHDVEAGEVVVHKDVVTEQKTINVPVTREEVVVERRPASGRGGAPGDIRPGEEIRVPVREEEVQLEKTPVIKEEIDVHKRKVQGTEQVSDQVRKEQARVERKGDVDVRDQG